MTRTIEIPGVEIPAPPRLSLDVPEDWEILVVPGVQLAVAEPRPEGRFRTNLVITVQRLAAGHDLERAREDIARRTAALPELEDLGAGDLEAGGRTWFASEYGYTPPGASTTVQAVRCTVLERGDVVDVVEVVGSCGADVAEAHIDVLRAAQDSLRVTGS